METKPYSEHWPSKRRLFEDGNAAHEPQHLAALWQRWGAALAMVDFGRYVVGVDPGIASERLPERTVNYHVRRTADRANRDRALRKRGRRG